MSVRNKPPDKEKDGIINQSEDSEQENDTELSSKSNFSHDGLQNEADLLVQPITPTIRILPRPPSTPKEVNLLQKLRDRDSEINELKGEIESYKKQLTTLRKRHDSLTKKHETELKLALDNKSVSDDSIVKLKKVSDEDEILRIKPKRKCVDGDLTFYCGYNNCTEKSVDLIKCNVCELWLCEKCSDVSITKFKTLSNKCKTIHFLCKSCESKIEETCHMPQNNMSNQVVNTIQNIIKEGFSQMETKIESTISDKINQKLNEVRSNEDDNSAQILPTYAQKVLEVPKEIRKIMQDERNEEKVERLEQDKRSPNFIIHNADEFGVTENEIKKADEEYVNDIVKHLKIKSKPLSVLRLGKKEEGKQRVLKVVMPNKDTQNKVMANLNKLKGTESTFGKISITNDYTSGERDQIKQKVAEAKELSRLNPDRIFEVRGDPKNGLRIVRNPL